MMKEIGILINLLIAPILLLAQSQKAQMLVSQMTLEEKVNLVVGTGMRMAGMPSQGPAIGQTEDKVPGAAGTTFAIERLNIPATVLADGPAGLRIEPTRKNDNNTYYATAFPIASLIASSWDTKLAEEVGKAMGKELRSYGVDVLLAPALNIHRNALGGRNFEYYSEDPLVSGKMAAAIVNGIESNGVGSSIKHFAANNQETNRNTVNTIVSERALREIYLRGFEITVKESQPWTVMSSYNKINGNYTSEDSDLLTTILRKEWGFKGLVMTDWFGGFNAVAQMKAGNDLLMPGIPMQRDAILKAVKNGDLPENILNQNAARVVDYVLETPSYKKIQYNNKPDLAAHAKLVRQAAAEGMILLKNDAHTLPLSKGKKIAAFGNASFAFIAGGTGSGDVNEAYSISLADGIKNNNLTIDEGIEKQYTQYLDDYNKKHPKKGFIQELMNPTPPAPLLEISTDDIEAAAQHNDIGIITIGRNAGEFRDRELDNDFNLSEAEQKMISLVSDAFHAKGKKVIAIINNGGLIEMVSWRNKVDAILMAWQGGQEGGNAVADIITGKVNPSGKLATTIPIRYADDISAKNFPGTTFKDKPMPTLMGMPAKEAEVVYEEGVYVGYRYYNSFGVETAYPFGYGLSYTQFSYSKLKIDNPTFDDEMNVQVTITNTGKVAGREVVQLYLAAPAGALHKPTAELKGFAKTRLLQPGESELVSFTLDGKALASYDESKSAWIANAGGYQVLVGASSTDIKQKASFNLPKERLVEQCHKVLTPKVDLKEMTR